MGACKVARGIVIYDRSREMVERNWKARRDWVLGFVLGLFTVLVVEGVEREAGFVIVIGV